MHAKWNWMSWRRCGLAALAVLMTACATPVAHQQELAASERARIRKVALLRVAEPQRMGVVDLGAIKGGGLAGGLIGAAIMGNVTDKRSKEFVDAIKTRKIRLGVALAESIQKELRGAGYTVKYLATENPKFAPDGKSDDYSHIQTDADAILNVWYDTTGYVAPAMGEEYRPWLNLKARLLDARTKQVLYYQEFSLGMPRKAERVDHLEAEGPYRYGSFDALMAKVDEAAEGLRKNQERVALRLAQQIR